MAAACSCSDWKNLLFPQTLPNTQESESLCGIFGWYVCFSHLIFCAWECGSAGSYVYTKWLQFSILEPQTHAHLGVMWPRGRVVPLLVTCVGYAKLYWIACASLPVSQEWWGFVCSRVYHGLLSLVFPARPCLASLIIEQLTLNCQVQGHITSGRIVGR